MICVLQRIAAQLGAVVEKIWTSVVFVNIKYVRPYYFDAKYRVFTFKDLKRNDKL